MRNVLRSSGSSTPRGRNIVNEQVELDGRRCSTVHEPSASLMICKRKGQLKTAKQNTFRPTAMHTAFQFLFNVPVSVTIGAFYLQS